MKNRLLAYGSLSTDSSLLRVNDVAALLAISRPGVYRLVRSGDIPTVRVGQRLRFRPADIETYLNREASP